MTVEQKATNITWHDGDVQRAEREQLLQQKGSIIWFTGLSGAGKSTLAVALENALYAQGQLVYRLDGDNIRHGLNKDLGFSPEDRTENIRRIGEVAKLFADAGVVTTASFVSPYRKDRGAVRALVEEGQFVEVHVACTVEQCEERDPKGLYKKARAGEIKGFTGIDAPYEAPENPEITVNTADMNVEESTAYVIAELKKMGILQ